jgi:hypothetical protein
LARQLVGLDVLLAAAHLAEHEPDETRADGDPDEEQPPIEFRVHRREV